MRLKSIDFLRGLAIILVLFRHHTISPLLKQVGWIGVDLFFVLSGFLVSGLLFREAKKFGTIKVGHFLIRRGFKIYPSFYLFLVFILFTKWRANQAINIYDFLGELFFLQNYLGKLSSHTWSLAVEEHFYFFLGFLIWILAPCKSKYQINFQLIPHICLVIALLSLVLRVLTHIYYPAYSYDIHLFPSHLRFDSLFFGVLLAYFYHYKPESLHKYLHSYKKEILLLSLLCISPAFLLKVDNFWMNTLGISALYLGFGGLTLYFLYFVQLNQMPNLLKTPFLMVAWIGYYSYTIYLWHLVVHYYGGKILNLISIHNVQIHFLIYFVMSVFWGAFISRYFESPFLKIRNRYYPSRALKPSSK